MQKQYEPAVTEV